jgi:hypothetical protein
VKLSLREAAAKTVTVPSTFGADEAPDVAVAPEPVEPEASEVPEDEEQALRASRAAADAPTIDRLRRAGRVITS